MQGSNAQCDEASGVVGQCDNVQVQTPQDCVQMHPDGARGASRYDCGVACSLTRELMLPGGEFGCVVSLGPVPKNSDCNKVCGLEESAGVGSAGALCYCGSNPPPAICNGGDSYDEDDSSLNGKKRPVNNRLAKDMQLDRVATVEEARKS